MKHNNKIASYGTRLSLALLLLFSALSSCTKEQFVGGVMHVENRLEISITLPQIEMLQTNKPLSRATTVDGTVEENEIKNVAIFVFNSEGTTLENLLVVNTASLPAEQTKWGSKTLTVPNINNNTKEKKIYVIANWDKSQEELSNYTETTLKEAITEITAVSELNDIGNHPILMSGSTEYTLAETTYTVTVPLTRQVAKLKLVLTLPIQTQIDFANIVWSVGDVKLTAFNIPNRSYLIGGGSVPSLGATPLTSGILAVPHISGTQNGTPNQNLVWEKSIYIHENLLAGANKDGAVRLVLQLPFKYRNPLGNTVVIENYYEVYIINSANTSDPYKIIRNTMHTLNLTIVGVGLSQANLVPNVNLRTDI